MQRKSSIPILNERHFEHVALSSSLYSHLFLVLQLKQPMIVLENEKRILNTMGAFFLSFFFSTPTPPQHKLPDQLAFPLKSYTLCSEPEPRIMGR